MNKQERIKKAIAFLKGREIITIQQDIVDKMEGNKSNISSALNGNEKYLTDAFLKRFCKTFPEINESWIINEVGEMINSNNSISVNEDAPTIPLLPISAQAGSLNDFIVSVKDTECERIVSPIKGADFAITVSGESMAPEYPNGSQILIKKIDEKAFIEWGKVYVLDTRNGSVIKRLVPSDKEGYVRCISINPDPTFAPFDVFIDDVNGFYRVMLCMAIK